MQSECARVTTAAETRFRVEAPNSRPRSVPVIALGAGSERLLKELLEGRSEPSFFGVLPGDAAPAAAGSNTLRNIQTGAAKDLGDVLTSADHVVVIVTEGEDSEMAPMISEACKVFNVPTTALLLGKVGATEQTLSKAASCFRPWVSMLVVADAEDYVGAMLNALRA